MSTSATSSPAITFSGIGSGIDTASIVEALMRIERQPIDRITSQKSAITAKRGVVQEINGLLTALRDAAAKMYGLDAFQAKTASSADPSVVTAAAATNAPTGTYNVVVSALAQAHTAASGAAPTLTAGTSLDITIGGQTTGVAVEAGDTLQTLADRINGTTDLGASASVVNDRLVLIARQSGVAGGMTFGGTAAADLGLATTQPGQDAAATINGLPVTGTGNVITGAIAGVDLTLAKVGSTTITVGSDTASSIASAKGFVGAYNALMRNVKLATSYDAATKTAGTLQGDQTMAALAGQLRSIAGGSVAGLGAHDSLAQIGITSARDGTLTLDESAFTAALAADPAGVASLFGADDGVVGAGPADGLARQIQAFANTFSTETLAARLTGFTSSLSRLDDRITGLEALMDMREARLKAQFTAMNVAVAQFQAQGNDLATQFANLSR
jgi:flagellar hook-associated protein 2